MFVFERVMSASNNNKKQQQTTRCEGRVIITTPLELWAYPDYKGCISNKQSSYDDILL